LGLNETVYSDEMCKRMVWLSGLLPYQQCQNVFERIGEQMVPSTSIWRQSQRHGARLQAHAEQQQAQVSVERVVLPDASQDHQQQKGVSIDAGMVNIQGEGWKEFKIGAIFEVEQRLARDERTNELVERAHGVDVEYTAILGSTEQFAPAFWTLAVEREVPTATDSSLTADGAEWIWNIAADYFPSSMQIVDWYHANQHLADAAKALFPDNEQKAQAWLKKRQDDLFQGNIGKITKPLDEHNLTAHSHYFHTHQRRMQYQEFQEQGYPIGSGTVESGVKQFKTRLSGAGMRWTRQAAQQMLIIRAAVLGKTFDKLWVAA
jgi:hypothetical protein